MTDTPPKEPEVVDLAIHNRPKRECRAAVDYLVTQAATVKKLYRSAPRVKRPRKEDALPSSSQESPPVTPTVSPPEEGSKSFPVTPPPSQPRSTPVTPALPPRTPPPPPPPSASSSTPTRVVLLTPSRPAAATAAAEGGGHSSSPDIIQVLLTTLSNRQALLKILQQRSMNELLGRVESVLGLPRGQVVVKHKGTDISADTYHKSLVELGIHDGDTLVLRVSTTEGRASPGLASPFRSTARLPVSPYKELPPWLKR